MTESFRHEDTSSERVQLEDGQVEVFFDGDQRGGPASVILDTAEVRSISNDTPYGIYEYDELVLATKSVLYPVDVVEEARVVEFAGSLEPYIVARTALLRTVTYREDRGFLDVIRFDSTSVQRRAVAQNILADEQKRIPASLVEQRELFDDDENLLLWVRLEATIDPDKDLIGRVIMARLAYFMSHDTQVGVSPIIYGVNGAVARIPQQLSLHESWLYSEIV